MNDANSAVQAAAVAALQAHPVLAQMLTGIYDGPPPRAAYPYISLGGGFVTDWSTKDVPGREVRLSVTIWDDGEEPARLHNLVSHGGDALAAMARDLPGWRVASNIFIRSILSREARGPRAALIEHRIRLLVAE